MATLPGLEHTLALQCGFWVNRAGECFTMKPMSEHRSGESRSGVSADYEGRKTGRLGKRSDVIRHSLSPSLPVSLSNFMPRPPHIVFAGGGTPGQLHPGLAVATHLIERIPDAIVTFVGGSRAVDRHVIRAAGFKFAGVPSQPAPKKSCTPCGS